METSSNGQQKDALNFLKDEILSMKNRLSAIENKLGIQKEAQVDKTPEPSQGKDVDWEKSIGESYISWLGIIVSLFAATFFVRLAFIKNWITITAQPVLLITLGLLLLASALYLKKRGYRRFCLALGIYGLVILFGAVYMATMSHKILSPDFLIYGPFLVWLLTVLLGLNEKTSVWSQFGFLGALLMPLFILTKEATSLGSFSSYHVLIYSNLLLALTFVISKWRDWRMFTLSGSVACHILIIVLLRQLRVVSEEYILFPWLLILLGAVLILWSSLFHVLDQRKPHRWEVSAWVINNIFLYFYIFIALTDHKNSFLLLVPVAVNGLLVLLGHYKELRHNTLSFFYSAMIIGAAIAITILFPQPFDIILLCLLSLALAYQGSSKHSWLFKGLSGMIVVWCLIFLFSSRFDLSFTSEKPILNLKFFAFFVTFCCFAAQGRLINSDTSAGKWGPFLGQGLLTIGLIIFLISLGREVAIVFPGKNVGQISDIGLLGLTVLGGAFSFGVAYVGKIMKWSYVCYVALCFVLGVVIKVFFFDMRKLGPIHLVFSFCFLAILLFGTSLLFKRTSRKQGELNNE